MKFFEILLLLSEFTLVTYLLMGKEFHSRHQKELLWIPFVLMLLHILIDGWRWQLIPAYAIGLLLAGISLKSFRLPKWIRISTGVLGVLLLLLSSAAAYLVPAFELPTPSGPYRVGARHLHLIDHAREEAITQNPHDKRELMVKVWYPTETASGDKEPYLSDAERRAIAHNYGMPSFFPAHFSHINSHTFKAPEIAEGKFPLLTFSHGYESPSDIYYATLTEIVSHGYIVAHISHTYENTITEFPDGRVLFNSDSFSVATNLNKEMGEVIEEWKQNMQKAGNKQDSIEAVREMMDQYSANSIIERWTTDISFVLDQLFELNEKSDHFLQGKINMEQVGALGHSTGGAAAGQVAIFDERIKAVVNWDGTQYGNAIDTVLQKPFLMLSHHPNPDNQYFNELVFHQKGPSDFYDARISGTSHINWMDVPFWIRLKDITFAGDIDMKRGISIINKTTLAFFDKHLQSRPVSVVSLEKEFPELEVALFNGGALAEKE